nr:MAG TPA: hypothetical protein [Caudoviricetes sp.]
MIVDKSTSEAYNTLVTFSYSVNRPLEVVSPLYGCLRK